MGGVAYTRLSDTHRSAVCDFMWLPDGNGHPERDVQSVEEVFPKGACADQRDQIAMGGGDDAHVGVSRVRAAQGFVGPFLEHAQEADLHRRADIADFIQEHGATFYAERLAVNEGVRHFPPRLLHSRS